MIQTHVTLTVPETDEELLFSIRGRCTARGHEGFFDHVSGAAEPPCGNEFEDEEWAVEWPADSGLWHPAPNWMVAIVMKDSDNADRLQEAFNIALREADDEAYDRYVDSKIDEAKERRHGL